jgi:hypothetical protein
MCMSPTDSTLDVCHMEQIGNVQEHEKRGEASDAHRQQSQAIET